MTNLFSMFLILPQLGLGSSLSAFRRALAWYYLVFKQNNRSEHFLFQSKKYFEGIKTIGRQQFHVCNRPCL